jgi:hypothetical protein
MSMKKSSDTIGNRTRDLPTCHYCAPGPSLGNAVETEVLVVVMNLPLMFGVD